MVCGPPFGWGPADCNGAGAGAGEKANPKTRRTRRDAKERTKGAGPSLTRIASRPFASFAPSRSLLSRPDRFPRRPSAAGDGPGNGAAAAGGFGGFAGEVD